MKLDEIPKLSFFIMADDDGITPCLNGTVFQKVGKNTGYVWIQDRRDDMDRLRMANVGSYCSFPSEMLILHVFPNNSKTTLNVNKIPMEPMI